MRVCLVVVVAGSAVVFGWNIGHSGYSDYYASAVRSMSEDWRAFFFGAFDPSSSITLDKLAGFLVPQALSVRILGFSAWALALPQALEGLVTILAAYAVIRRWAGYGAGVVGAVVTACTPLLVTMFSHPMEDAMLTACTTVALLAWQISLDTGRARYLFYSAAAVGLGFQAKMMQAWLVLPAMAVVYAVMQTHRMARKIRDLCAAAAVTLILSLSWMTAIALVPAGKRAFIDGSTDNSIFSMVFGYNGVNRYLPGFVPGALAPGPGAQGGGGAGQQLAAPGWLVHNPLKLLVPYYATQIGWLYPLVLVGLVLGVVFLRRNLLPPPASLRLKAGLLLATALLLTEGMLMGLTAIPHPVYLAGLAVPLAGLAAMGATLLWKSFAMGGTRLRYAPALYLLIQTLWTIGVMETSGTFASWLLPFIEAGGVLSCLLAFIGANRPRLPDRGRLLAGFAACLVLAGPCVWSLSTLDPRFDGSANDAYAGPRPATIDQASNNPLHPGMYGPGLNSDSRIPELAATESAAYRFARLHTDFPSGFILATDSWRSAAPLIMEGGTRLLPLGGYSSQAPNMAPPEMARLVTAGSLRFVLLKAASRLNDSPANITGNIRPWVRAHCSEVPVSRYMPSGASLDPSAASSTILFDCSPH